MAQLDFSTFEPVMKTRYIDGINDNSNRATILLKHIQKNSEDVGGNFAQLSLLRRGNPGTGSRSETGTLPTASFAKHEKATYGMKTLYGRGQITGKVSRASAGAGANAFADALDTQLQSLMRDLPAEHNRMLFGDGTGSMSTCNTTTASTTVNVVSTQYFQEDDIIDIAPLSTGTPISNGSAVSIQGVDDDNNTITLAAAVTTNSTHHIFRTGSYNQEIYGLKASHSASNPPSPAANFGHINRTAKGFWQATELANGGVNRALTRGLMQQGLMKSHTKGGGDITLIICHPDMWITYGNILAPDQRFNDLIYEIDGGFEALKFVRTPVVFDKDSRNNRMFFMDLDALHLFEYEEGYSWMEADGSILRYVQNKDQVEFTLLKDAQYGSSASNRQVILKDLSVNLN